MASPPAVSYLGPGPAGPALGDGRPDPEVVGSLRGEKKLSREAADTVRRTAHSGKNVSSRELLPEALHPAYSTRRVAAAQLPGGPPPKPGRLRARVEGGAAVIEVEDRGAGIPEEDLPNLFRPFFRGDRSRTCATGGVGLGLALARRIVEAHGGRLAIESRVGEGTTARIALPAEVGEAA